MSDTKRVAVFAHHWHWVAACEPVVEELINRGMQVSLFVLRDPDIAYFERLSVARMRHPTLGGFSPDSTDVRLMHLFGAVPVFGELLRQFLVFRWTNTYLKRVGPDVLIVTDDRALSHPLAVLRAARSRRIPTVLYPSETLMRVAGLEVDKAAIMSYPTLLRRCMRRIVEWSYPASVRNVRGVRAHFYVPSHVLPFLLWHALLPPNPWVRGSNTALKAVAVNSRSQLKEDASHGVLPERMVITGFPPHDRFASLEEDKADLKMQFEQKFNVPPGSKIFLILGTHFRGVYDPAELPAVEREVKEAFRTLCENVPEEFFLVVKLHPNTDAQQWVDYFDRTARPMVFIHREWDAYRLVAIADTIFMFASSVVMAALATDVPVLAYKLRLPSFDAFYRPYRSIALLADVPQLRQALAALETPLSGALHERRLFDRRNLGLFDGKNTERFCNLVEKLIQ